MSNSVTHGLHHARLPCPSLSPGVGWNSRPLSQWCHLTIPSSADPLFFPSTFPNILAPVNQFFPSGGQSIGASVSVSILPMNIQGLFPLGLIGWISLQFKRFSRVFSNTGVRKNQFFDIQPSLWSNSHIYTWLLENQSFHYILCWSQP